MGPKKHPLQTAEDQALDKVARRRLAQARYSRTEKGRAARARYNRSRTRLATAARYRSTPRGHAINTALNARRIFVGNDYHGHAPSVATAKAINAHIRERIREFISR